MVAGQRWRIRSAKQPTLGRQLQNNVRSRNKVVIAQMSTHIHYMVILILFLLGCDSNRRSDSGPVDSPKLESHNEIVIAKRIILGSNDKITIDDNDNHTFDQLSDTIDLLASTTNARGRPKVIELKIEPTLPVGYVKKVKRLIQKHSTKVLVLYGNGLAEGQIVRLPPLINDRPDLSKLRDRNVLRIVLEDTGAINLPLRNQNQVSITELRKKTKEFLVSDTSNINLPLLSTKNIEYCGEVMTASSAIIALMSEDSVPYKRYEEVYYTLFSVYKELWDQLAEKQFNSEYESLDRSRKIAIRTIYPLVIGELEQ